MWGVSEKRADMVVVVGMGLVGLEKDERRGLGDWGVERGSYLSAYIQAVFFVTTADENFDL
jgi:hypothetical protein